MLSTVITLFETIKTIGYFTITVSYNTGKIIVNGFVSCFEVLYKLLNILWTVLVILEEDLLVFLSDLFNRIIIVLQGIHNSIEYLAESIAYLFTCIKHVILGTSDAIIAFFQTAILIITKVISNFGTLIASIKHLVVLFGSGVWFVISIVPIFIVYLCMMTTYYIGRSFEELKTLSCILASQITTGIQEIITFVTDVPLESLAGLLICFCLIYAIVVFHITVYSKLRRLMGLILAYTVTQNRYFIQIKNLLLRRRSNRSAQVTADGDSSSSSSCSDPDYWLRPLPPLKESTAEGWITKRERRRQMLYEGNRLCVICLERNKCILAMPCRHMCTCKECNTTLQNYQRTCPLCRRFVNYTIHVY